VRALVVGASGLVGSALLRSIGSHAVGTYRTRQRPGLLKLDASDKSAFEAVLRRVRPDVLFMPASEPNVEWCELHPDQAQELNLAPIRAALRLAGDTRVLGYSSDYVFDGRQGPYAEDAEPRPLSVYGQVKLELEQLLVAAGHTVIRTTTVFGFELDPPKNFVLRLTASLRRGDTVLVPNDQVSTPTFADDLAAASVRVAEAESGLWHVAGPEVMARDEFANRVAEVFGLRSTLIQPVPTSELGQAAARPLRGGLLCARFLESFGPPHRPMLDALRLLRSQVEAGRLLG